MARISVHPKILSYYLVIHSERVMDAMKWVCQQDDPVLIEVPDHLAPTIRPQDGNCKILPSTDYEATWEVLRLILDAMKPTAKEGGKRKQIKKPHA